MSGASPVPVRRFRPAGVSPFLFPWPILAWVVTGAGSRTFSYCRRRLHRVRGAGRFDRQDRLLSRARVIMDHCAGGRGGSTSRCRHGERDRRVDLERGLFLGELTASS